MDNNTIFIDRDMAHVILMAFSVAAFEAMSSLIERGDQGEKGIVGRPEGRDYSDAELRVLKAIRALYPDIADQYFDVNKQVQ